VDISFFLKFLNFPLFFGRIQQAIVRYHFPTKKIFGEFSQRMMQLTNLCRLNVHQPSHIQTYFMYSFNCLFYTQYI
jgi:hypothetical protein